MLKFLFIFDKQSPAQQMFTFKIKTQMKICVILWEIVMYMNMNEIISVIPCSCFVFHTLEKVPK